jgi:hypothetical protein
MMPPATAILASSLLQSSSYKECDNDTTWDLTGDIDTGVPHSRDESNVFNCGRVVGVSGIQHTISTGEQQAGDNAGENIQVWTGEVRYLHDPKEFDTQCIHVFCPSRVLRLDAF